MSCPVNDATKPSFLLRRVLPSAVSPFLLSSPPSVLILSDVGNQAYSILVYDAMRHLLDDQNDTNIIKIG